MANTKSAKKAARQAVRKAEVNKARRSRTRTSVRKVEEMRQGDPDLHRLIHSLIDSFN